MGQCILNFDQIHILDQKSAGGHSDNDWIIVVWFVGNKIARTDKLPLMNTKGSTILNTGDAIQPFNLAIDCTDADLVTATFQVVNLGSADYSEQIEAAGKQAEKIGEALAEAYVRAAAFVVEHSGLPAASVFADGLNELAPTIADTVGAVLNDVIVPFAEDVVDFVQGLLGTPNCNGDVLHDITIFKPFQPEIAVSKVYDGASKSGCGHPRTHVHLTLQRIADPVPLFPNTPPPQTELRPAVGASMDKWIDTWAEDSLTPTPRIVVRIERSLKASGLLHVTAHEVVDQRFNAVYDAAADPISPDEREHAFQYTGNVFGTIRPWLSNPVAPGDLRFHTTRLAP